MTRQITPDVIRNAALQLHEDRGATASALNAAVPSTLTALSDVASSDAGARHLRQVIDETRRSTGHIDEDRSLFPSVPPAGGVQAAQLIDDELGPRSSSIAAAVASASGVSADSAHRLMGGVATVAVAALAKASGGIAPGALQSLFREQRGRWVERLPGPLASLFSSIPFGHGRPAAASFERPYDDRSLTGPAIRELEAPRRNWVIPAILVALALLAIPLLRQLRGPRPPALPAQPPITEPVPLPSATPPIQTTPAPSDEPANPPAPRAAAPAAAADQFEPGSLDDLSAFLGASGEMTPHAFAPSPLNFPFASAQPTPESMKTLDDIAGALKAHPAATIRVESHTDDIGTQASNLSLSQARAEAVKSELIARGIDGSRIDTAGMGRDLPVASNDTPEGRARNRRTEIVVTGR